MGRVGKRNLAKIVSQRAGVAEAWAYRMIASTFEAIAVELAKGNSVTMTGFGTWRTKICSPRICYNPNDGSHIEVPARTRVSFRAGSKLREVVESTVEPEVFFGEGVGWATEFDAVFANLFGIDPETFNVDDATERIREALGPAAEHEAKEFFATLRAKTLCAKVAPPDGDGDGDGDDGGDDDGDGAP